MEAGVRACFENERHRGRDEFVIRPIFDSHKTYSGRVKQGFDSFCQRNPICSRYLLPPHYEVDQKYVSLQVADNIAFEVRKLVLSELSNRKERVSMTRLKESHSIGIIYKLDYGALKALADSEELTPVIYSLSDVLKIR